MRILNSGVIPYRKAVCYATARNPAVNPSAAYVGFPTYRPTPTGNRGTELNFLPVADFSFGELLLFVFIVIPVTIAWVAAVVDIFARRPDLHWWAKGLWLLFVLVLPLLGMLIYFIARPMMPDERAAYDEYYAAAPRE